MSSLSTHLSQSSFDEPAGPIALPRAAQWSIRFDPGSPDDPRFAGIDLPEALAGAAPRRRLHFLAGRYCARRALEALGTVPVHVPGWHGSNTPPDWPPHVVGSITHTDGFAWAAVARTADVRALGIDSERAVTATRAGRVGSVVISPAEKHLMVDAGCDDTTATVLVFSAKEAVFKCLYPIVGRYFGYEDVRVVSLVVDSGTFGVRLDTPLSSEFPAGTVLEGRYRQDRDFVHTAVCLEGLRKA